MPTEPIISGGIGAVIVAALAAIIRHLEIRTRFSNGMKDNRFGTEEHPLVVKLATQEHDLLTSILNQANRNSEALTRIEGRLEK